MIIYDLKCEKDHKFEGWFKDRLAYEEQKAQKLIACPICGSVQIEMVISSISIMGKDARSSKRDSVKELSPMKAIKIFHEYIEKNFENVSDKFADIALKIHHGEEERRNIRGTTTEREEEILREEGVEFFKIPIPKFDS